MILHISKTSIVDVKPKDWQQDCFLIFSKERLNCRVMAKSTRKLNLAKFHFKRWQIAKIQISICFPMKVRKFSRLFDKNFLKCCLEEGFCGMLLNNIEIYFNTFLKFDIFSMTLPILVMNPTYTVFRSEPLSCLRLNFYIKICSL